MKEEYGFDQIHHIKLSSKMFSRTYWLVSKRKLCFYRKISVYIMYQICVYRSSNGSISNPRKPFAINISSTVFKNTVLVT